jgi:hypothetical protein
MLAAWAGYCTASYQVHLFRTREIPQLQEVAEQRE